MEVRHPQVFNRLEDDIEVKKFVKAVEPQIFHLMGPNHNRKTGVKQH